MKKVPSGNLLLMTETSQHRQQLSPVFLNYLLGPRSQIYRVHQAQTFKKYFPFFVLFNVVDIPTPQFMYIVHM